MTATSPSPAQTGPQAPPRPRIGLVLSGGGARGLAHVGVLKVLEREHIPIDVIAGTSMGSIIGGLYASGMSATQIEAELMKVDWDALFARRVSRQELSQRRKEEDYASSPIVEIGLRDGEFSLPVAGVSSRGLELLLRRYVVPVRGIDDFDKLPIPFRAVATDLETGAAVVLKDGDLAAAMRSSMSVPGVFVPTELNHRILGDGGLVNNVPIDVARAMGADIVIVVNIGTPLARRETLNTLLGVSSQMINILTEQNVQRSLATLDPTRDLLISPPLGELTSSDFVRTRELIALGETHAATLSAALARFSIGDEPWQRMMAARARGASRSATLVQVRFEGAEISNPQRLAAQLESQPGERFDIPRAERDAQALAANGDYMRTDYHLEDLPNGTGLVFDLEEKPWGPHYFRIGLDLSSDFAGRGDFNLKIAHNRHWLNAKGAEWRNRLQIGSNPRWFSELYQPLAWNLALSNDWFVATYGEITARKVSIYGNNAQPTQAGSLSDEIARYKRTAARAGVDLGQPWGRFGELRMGLTALAWRDEPEIVSSSYTGRLDTQRWQETGIHFGVVMDQLDFATFPTRGWRLEAENVIGQRRGPIHTTLTERESFNRIEVQGSVVRSVGRHTLDVFGRGLRADQQNANGLGRYTLGGFQNMSGYAPGQIEGNYLLFGRLTYYYRLNAQPLLTRGFFVGATLEAGNAWAQRGDVSLGDLRQGGSLFVGADTGIGPLYFGTYYAPKGSSGIYLLLGRP